mgnify:CR=1 FL=1
MENYQEQYKQELHQQEINSNLRTLKGFLWIFVTILILWLLTLVGIFIVDAGIFTMAVGMSVVIGIPVLYIYKKVDLSRDWVKYVLLCNIGSHGGIFVFSCCAYLCIAAFISGAVPGKDDTVGYLCRE